MEVLVTGRRREGLRHLRWAGEGLGRGVAFQLFAEKLLDQWAEVDFLACFEGREEDVETGWEARDEGCWDGVVNGCGPADVQFVALLKNLRDLVESISYKCPF